MTQVVLDSIDHHRISDKVGANVATVRFTPSTADGSPITAYRIQIGGMTMTQGVPAGRRGVFVGKDLVLPFSFDDFSSPSGTQIVEDVTYDEMVAGQLSDGDYTVNIWVYSDTEGWNA